MERSHPLWLPPRSTHTLHRHPPLSDPRSWSLERKRGHRMRKETPHPPCPQPRPGSPRCCSRTHRNAGCRWPCGLPGGLTQCRGHSCQIRKRPLSRGAFEAPIPGELTPFSTHSTRVVLAEAAGESFFQASVPCSVPWTRRIRSHPLLCMSKYVFPHSHDLKWR